MSSDLHDQEQAYAPFKKSGVGIDGKRLIVPLNYVFPQVCVLSGDAPATSAQRIRVRVVDYKALVSPMEVIGHLLAWVPLSKKADVTVFMLPQHRQGYSFWRTLMWLSLCGAFAVPAIVIQATGDEWGFLAFPILMLAAAVIYLAKARCCYAEEITRSSVYLAGLKPHIMRKIYEAAEDLAESKLRG